MVYRKNGTEKILAQFIKEARKRITIDKVILFGSFVRGAPTKYSDIDIAVISSAFNHMNEFQRIKLLLGCAHRIKSELPCDIETFGYTPDEYSSATRFDFLGVIKDTGKIIYSS